MYKQTVMQNLGITNYNGLASNLLKYLCLFNSNCCTNISIYVDILIQSRFYMNISIVVFKIRACYNLNFKIFRLAIINHRK